MPVLKLQSNKRIDNQKNWMKDATAFLSETLSKPEKFIMVHVEENHNMMFAGSMESMAYIELKSVNLPEEQTKGFSAAICDFVENTTGIPKGRIYIEFANAPRHMFGYNGATFER